MNNGTDDDLCRRLLDFSKAFSYAILVDCTSTLAVLASLFALSAVECLRNGGWFCRASHSGTDGTNELSLSSIDKLNGVLFVFFFDIRVDVVLTNCS